MASRFKFSDALFPVASIILIIAGWWFVVAFGWVVESVLPKPPTVARALMEELESGRLLKNLGTSILRLLMGFVMGGTFGVVLGLLLGRSWKLRSAVLPIVEILRPIPPLAWIPVAIIWFGIEEASKVFLIAMAVFFPVVIASFKGAMQVDDAIIRSAQSLDVPRTRMVFLVVLPAAMPDIVTGVRLGWTLGIASLIGAEMIATSSGVGAMMISAMNAGNSSLVIGGILLIGTFSMVTDNVFNALARAKMLRWHAGIEGASA